MKSINQLNIFHDTLWSSVERQIMLMIDVLYVFDDNYAPYAGISITTMLRNNPNDKFTVFCCEMDVSETNKNKIQKVVDSYGQILVWISSDKSEEYINSCNTGYWNGSKATWMKIFVLWELPNYIERILYIDCDTLVHEGVRELYEVALDNHPLAMARDSLGNTYGNKYYNTRTYYNAGVIVFDVKYWKNNEFKKTFLECLDKNVNIFKDNEQGLLNFFFKEQIKLLPLKYNTQGFLFLYKADNYLAIYKDFPFYDCEEIEKSKNKPVITHFFRMFGQYPWEKNNHHPNRNEFEKQKSISLWSDLAVKETRIRLVFRAEYLLYVVLSEKMYLKWYRRFVEHGI